jgi:leucyl-tRNA synthetase
MGTKLPWDPEWIIESLSDSTIYMAYYTIVKHLKKHKIQPNQLTEEVFDYIFLGVGNAKEIAQKVGLDAKVLMQMHEEFLYFYPLDSRHSGRDLVPNHLTFLIFNHTAIFPENLWPRQIATNGSVMMKGVKMSKSFGNIIPLREALKMFGADPLRLSVLGTAELLQDAEFSPSIAKSMGDKLEHLYKSASEIAKTQGKRKVLEKMLLTIDRWMLTRLQEHIRKATESMDKLAVRKAIHSALYELDQDFQWYQTRVANQKENAKRKSVIAYVSNEVLDVQLRMLAPFAPHTCEEIWELTDKKGFVSLNSWPTPDESKIDISAEENESLIMDISEDTHNIIKATSITPKKICYYVAAPWKWKVYVKVLEKSRHGEVRLNELMKELSMEDDLKRKLKEIPKFASKIIMDINKVPEKRRGNISRTRTSNEKEVIEDAKDFLRQKFDAQIAVYDEEDMERYDPKQKAMMSMPYRPAIYIE